MDTLTVVICGKVKIPRLADDSECPRNNACVFAKLGTTDCQTTPFGETHSGVYPRIVQVSYTQKSKYGITSVSFRVCSVSPSCNESYVRSSCFMVCCWVLDVLSVCADV